LLPLGVASGSLGAFFIGDIHVVCLMRYPHY
jgi:hypothetical protein